MGSTAAFNQIFLGIHLIGPIDGDIHLHDDIEGSEGNSVLPGQNLRLKRSRNPDNIADFPALQSSTEIFDRVGRR
jgi:hypothetical protein